MFPPNPYGPPRDEPQRREHDDPFYGGETDDDDDGPREPHYNPGDTVTLTGIIESDRLDGDGNREVIVRLGFKDGGRLFVQTHTGENRTGFQTGDRFTFAAADSDE